MEKAQAITVSTRTFGHALTGIKQAGFDVNALLSQCGIPKEILNQPEARIPLTQAVKLHNYCTFAIKDEALGLLHRPVQQGFFRMLALTLLHSGTLGRALERGAEFHNLFDNSLRQSVVIKGKQVECISSRIPGHRILNDYVIDHLLLVSHRLLGWLCNERIILNQVKLDFAPPDYRAEYPYMYHGAPVLFQQSHNSLSFDSSYLDHPIVQTEASVESYIKRAPMDIYLPLDAGGPLTQAVRKHSKEVFLQQPSPPSLETIAAAMAIHPQTLRRRLKEEGTNYNIIKAQLRRDIAIHHLSHPETSVEQIAGYTGYAEPSAFIRAFKSWTGLTPLQFRRGQETAVDN